MLLVGALAAGFAIVFRLVLHHAVDAILGTPDILKGFARLPFLYRLALPAVGGTVAAAISLLATRAPGGHGVAVILESVALGRGQIRLPAVLLKAAASLAALCTGESIGREGPIIQFGGGSGSVLGRAFGLSGRETRMLIAAGTGAGFAAAYNTPFAAVLFVIEIVTGVIGVDILVPVAAATAVATTLTRLAIGGGPIYGVRKFGLVSEEELVAYCALGVLAGICGPSFLAALSAAERVARRIPVPRLLLGALGGVLVGALAIVFPQVTGNGYEAIQLILDAKLVGLILAALLVAKAAATIFSVSSGAPGGVFTPSMFLGAALGGLVGTAVPHLFAARASAAEAGGYALAGMATMVAATTHAPLMAATLAFELSGDYSLVIPLLASTAIAALLSRRLREDSVYTEELRRRGIPWRGSLTQRLAHAVAARDILTMDPPQVDASASLEDALAKLSEPDVRVVYVPGTPLRALDLNDLKRLWPKERLPNTTAGDCAREVSAVSPQDSLLDLAQKLWTAPWGELPVVEGDRLAGIVTRRALLGALDAEVLRRDVLLTRVVRFEGEDEAEDFFELPADRRIEEIALPAALRDVPLHTSQVRERFGVVVLALRRAKDRRVEEIKPGCRPAKGDRLLVLGAPAAIDALRDASAA
ncbi:MAG TPA: chloride channel protein [Myxococcales bacterium]